MPGLIAFRRRWSTGSDDLVVPCFLLFTLHIILFIVIAIIIGTSADLEAYSSLDIGALKTSVPLNQTLIDKAVCAKEIRNYTIGYLVLIALAGVIEFLMTCFSMQGTILEPGPRGPVEYLIYLRMAFGLIEMIFSIISAVQISLHWSVCGVVRELNHIHTGIVVVNILVFLIVLLVGYCVFDPAGGKYYKVKNAYDQESMSASRIEKMRNELDIKSRKTWLSRLSNCFCCVSNNSTNIKQVALDEVSTLLHNFFKDYDFVLSDIIAGLTLLRHKQQCLENDTTVSDENDIKEFMCGRPITPDTTFVDLGDKVTKAECEDMTYYCVYGLAAYGPLFYWIENTGTGLCGVFNECLCGKNPTCTSSCCVRQNAARRRRTLIRGDSGCGWVLAGIRRSLIDHGVCADIVYVSLENDVSKQLFFVCVDHEKKTVVVTIRGTLAEADALTDLVASCDHIDTEENDGTWKAHKGMLRGAEYIKKKLLYEEMALSLGFGHSLAKGTRDYNLVLVGHSLGAGVASILAILLHPVYPNLKCYAFSPPGGLLSYSAMLASRNYIHTLIFGKDVVPRAGLPQMEVLRNEVIDLLKHTDLPKYKIILGNVCGSLEHRHGLLRAERLSSRALRVATRRINSVSADTTAVELVSPVSDELYPPGRIYHLVYSSEIVPGCGSEKRKKKYHLIYADNVTDFNEIIVSHQMISHHLPQEVLRCVRKALQNFPNERINHSYAQSETLPFAENRANSMQRAGNHKANNNKGTSPPEQRHVTTESRSRTSYIQSDASEDSDQPFLNTNQNNIVNVAAEIRGIAATTSSSSSSSSSLPDTTAPLARPESFTLSSLAQSPITPNTFSEFSRNEGSDVVANDRNESTASDALLTPIPQASSTPFIASKTFTVDSADAASYNGQNFQTEERDDSNISCDDLNVDLHGMNAVS